MGAQFIPPIHGAVVAQQELDLVDLLLMVVDRVEADGHPGGEETPAGTDGHLDGGTEDDPDVGSPSACPDQEVGQVRLADLGGTAALAAERRQAE